jgi:putative AdoMet-dependent methyltransferase
MPQVSDLFPPADFDAWAARYDEDVGQEGFPFTGYGNVLAECVRLADARAGMAVLDLGAGTGNLTERFLSQGCQVWGTDFSNEMLRIAQEKYPAAHFVVHDLRQPFPPELNRGFDRIVSAYMFHHFELAEKMAIIERLMKDMLAPHGRLVIADISFPSIQALEAVRQAAGDGWDEEAYWVAPQALRALEAIRVEAEYGQVSECAGVYLIKTR